MNQMSLMTRKWYNRLYEEAHVSGCRLLARRVSMGTVNWIELEVISPTGGTLARARDWCGPDRGYPYVTDCPPELQARALIEAQATKVWVWPV